MTEGKAEIARYLSAAIDEAKIGLSEGGIPIGSVLVRDGQIVARGHNRRVQARSAILHAEMDCLESIGRQSAEFYRRCLLVTTLSPCSMCSGCIRLYRIPRLIIGENRTFRGDEDLLKMDGIQLDLIDSDECFQLMKQFIETNPQLWNEDIGKT